MTARDDAPDDAPDDHRVFFELSPDLLCVLDLEGRILDINPAWQQAFELAAEDLVGTLLESHVFEADRAIVQGALRDLGALSKGSEADPLTATFVCRFRARRREDGARVVYRSLAFNASARPDAPLVLAVARDVTEQEQGRRRLVALFDGASDMIAITTQSGGILYLNRAGLELAGRAGQDPTSLSTKDLLTKAERVRLVGQIIPTLNAEGIWKGESDLLRPDGETIPTATTLVWVRGDEGSPEAFGSIVIDLRAKMRATTNLRELKALLDNTTDLVTLSDLNGRFLYINPAGMAFLGREGEDPGALTTEDLIPPDELQRTRDIVRPALLERGLWAGERRLRRKDGTLMPVSDVIALLHNARGEPDAIATISRDLSESKRLETSLKEAIAALGAPILRVAEGVLALPLVGKLDRVRAARIMDDLLRAIAEARARAAILDLTGVKEVDGATIEHLFQVIAAASLLGALALVSGVSPKVATAIVELDLETRDLRTFGTLEEALRFAQRYG